MEREVKNTLEVSRTDCLYTVDRKEQRRQLDFNGGVWGGGGSKQKNARPEPSHKPRQSATHQVVHVHHPRC